MLRTTRRYVPVALMLLPHLLFQFKTGLDGLSLSSSPSVDRDAKISINLCLCCPILYICEPSISSTRERHAQNPWPPTSTAAAEAHVLQYQQQHQQQHPQHREDATKAAAAAAAITAATTTAATTRAAASYRRQSPSLHPRPHPMNLTVSVAAASAIYSVKSLMLLQFFAAAAAAAASCNPTK